MRLAKLCSFAVSAGLLLPVTCLSQAGTSSRTVTPLGLALLKSATRVQTFRVKGIRATLDSVPGKTLDGYTIVRKGGVQAKAFTQNLARAITGAFTYSGPQDRCRLSPAVAYRFEGRSETVDVFVCFRCRDVAVIERDASGKIVNCPSTKLSGSAYDQLARSAQQSFPDDAALKAL